MTYQTNPITTRLKITRGWFQEYFPQDTLSYSSETLFFYKYYLLINFLMQKNKINLIRSNITTDNKNINLAYFNIQKQLVKKRNSVRQLMHRSRRKKYMKKQRRLFFKLVGFNRYFRHLKNVNFNKRKTTVFRTILRVAALRNLTIFKLQSWDKNSILNRIKSMSKHISRTFNVESLSLQIKRFSTQYRNAQLFVTKKKIQLNFFSPRTDSLLNIKPLVNKAIVWSKRQWFNKHIISNKLCYLKKKINKFNKRINYEFRIKEQKFRKKLLTRKKKKILKSLSLKFTQILLSLSLNLQRQMRTIFLISFYVKLNQTLHRLISTRLLLSRKGRSNLFSFKWNLKKLSRFKSYARSALVINKYLRITIIMQIMKTIFEKYHKNKKPFFELFRTLMKINSPRTLQKSKLVFCGKRDRKSRTKTIVMGSQYQEINKFSSAHYHRRINYVAKQGNERAGSFFLKIFTDAGSWNRGY